MKNKSPTDSKDLLNLMSSFGFKQYINDPTRIGDNNKRSKMLNRIKFPLKVEAMKIMIRIYFNINNKLLIGKIGLILKIQKMLGITYQYNYKLLRKMCPWRKIKIQSYKEKWLNRD